QKVLINGASGGIGTFAVQIAKAFGAEVTGVCSTKNVELVRSLGADHVIDYTREDFTAGGPRFDRIIDAAAFRPVWESVRALVPGGTYVMVGGQVWRIFQTMFVGWPVSLFTKRSVRALSSKPNTEDLSILKDLIEAGKLVPVIDRRYALREIAEAIRYIEQGHAHGKVVITV
ncbi:MAG TPA: NAD(P)-dependent alcohol dehydrogenase, partial [Polyangiaceae bacterium]